MTRPQPPGATYWTNTTEYYYTLKDDKGDVMPCVWVQERFPVNNLGLEINGSGNSYFWITLLSSTLDSGSVSATDGRFDTPDHFWYTWPANDSATKTTTHTYYAGTQDATYNATTGINVGSSTITFVPGSPGTSGQSAPTPPNPNP